MSVHDHRTRSEGESTAGCAILVVSDSQTLESDTSGKCAAEILTAAGHSVLARRIVPNNEDGIRREIEDALREADLVLTIGGTGISRRDLSIDAARDVVEKEMEGFGELFRQLSFQEVGTAAILSRAMLGVTHRGKIVVCLPGSEAAVRLALEKILLRELKHILWEVRRYE